MTELRRVLRSPNAIVVGPEGLWVQDVGRIRWDQVASIRLEAHKGVGGADADRLVRYRRLGIVPSDPALLPGPSRIWSPVWRAFRPLMDPRGYAPLGVWDFELADPIEEVVERIRVNHDVDPPP